MDFEAVLKGTIAEKERPKKKRKVAKEPQTEPVAVSVDNEPKEPAVEPPATWFGPIRHKIKTSQLLDAETALRRAKEPIRKYGETDEDVIERSGTIQQPETKKQQPIVHLTGSIDLTKITTNQGSVLLQCRDYIHELLSQWQETNPDDKLLVETKRWLVPLLVKLKKDKLEEDLAISVATILSDLQRQEYTQANEDYLKLSVGNVAWPIGIIGMVHQRTVLDRIEQGKVSNIMKDQTTRQWILGLKRLITATATTTSHSNDPSEQT